jgi:hypothetical protein
MPDVRPFNWRHALVYMAIATPGLFGGIAFARLNPSEIPTIPEWNRATPLPDRVILTWSGDPATTQSVTWRTDTTVARAVAQYALASPGPGFGHEAQTMDATSATLDARHVQSSGAVVRYHSATLTGLQPDTVYAYRVGDGERWSEWFHFRTASRTRRPFSFLYVGDAQNDILAYWSRAIRRGFIEAPEARFILHAGDLVTDAHSDLQWGEWFRAGGWIHAMVPSVPAPGNHEFRPYSDAEEAQSPDAEHLAVSWRPQFTLPRNGILGEEETSYYLDYQGARIVVLNSSGERAAQAEWLDSVLARDPQPWTIVTFHHPIFSSARERDNPELRALWKPVLDRHAVDLVLQGHDHSYARGRTTAGARNVASGLNPRDGPTGPVYVVSVSGPKQYLLKKDLWNNYDARLDRRGENTQLYQVVRIAGDTLRYRSYTVLGALYDAFDLIRGRGPNRFIERLRPDAATRTFADGPGYPYPK